MELEEHHTCRDDERGEPRVRLGFLRNPGATALYL
jgi:hypothetical protein